MNAWMCRVVLCLVLAGGLVACASREPRGVPLPATAADCHPQPDAQRAQYIVGYGSLMQDESRRRTSPQAGPAHPVEVAGYRRGWFAKGDPVGFSTTYLGVLADPNQHLNAVVYRVAAQELAATDQREAQYCRVNVHASAITALEAPALDLADGQTWIYVNQPVATALPSARFPIVQSYVDIFVSGCLEQEQRFGLTGFARQCLATTQDWSVHWINDRPSPRRPFIFQPKAHQIDTLLAEQLPVFFAQIRIE